MSRQDFVSALKSFIAFARCLGFVDFVITDKRKIEHSKNAFKITTIVLVAIIVAFIIIYYYFSTAQLNEINVITVSKCILLSDCVAFAINVLMHKFHTQEKLNILKHILHLEQLCWSMNISINHKSLKIRAVMLNFVYAVVVSILFATYNVYLDMELSSLRMSMVLLYYYLYLTEMVVCSNFYLQMYAIKDIFILLDQNMKKKMLRINNPYPRSYFLIRKTAQIHQELCKLAMLISRTMSVQIVFALTSSFVTFTFYLYITIQNILSGTMTGMIIVGCGFAIVRTTKTALYILIAHQCVARVSRITFCFRFSIQFTYRPME